MGVKRGNHLRERTKGSKAIFADGKSHGAERSDGREAHQYCYHTKYGLREALQKVNDGFAARTSNRQCEAEQKRDEQNLQDVSSCKSVDDRIRNNMRQELRDALRFGLAGVLRHRRGVPRGGIDIETASRGTNISPPTHVAPTK